MQFRYCLEHGGTSFFACDEFWKDVRRLRKHVRPDFLQCPYSDDELESLSCSQKLDCIPLLQQITNTITNKVGKLDEIPNNNKVAKHQPFLPISFIFWKLRWAVDKNGAMHGLRILYCFNERHVVFASIKHKKDALETDQFIAEAIERLRYFFAVSYKIWFLPNMRGGCRSGARQKNCSHWPKWDGIGTNW